MRYQTVAEFLGGQKNRFLDKSKTIILQEVYSGKFEVSSRDFGVVPIDATALVDTENLERWATATANDFVPDGSREVPPIEDPEQNDFIPK